MTEYISPRTGKIVPNVILCSHAELECHHYQALKNQGYRQEVWCNWHEPYMEPSLCQTPRTKDTIQQTPPVYQADGFVTLKTTMADLKTKLDRHIDASKKKKETSRFA